MTERNGYSKVPDDDVTARQKVRLPNRCGETHGTKESAEARATG